MATAPLKKILFVFQVPGQEPYGTCLSLWTRGDPGALTLPQFGELFSMVLYEFNERLRIDGLDPAKAELVRLEIQDDPA